MSQIDFFQMRTLKKVLIILQSIRQPLYKNKPFSDMILVYFMSFFHGTTVCSFPNKEQSVNQNLLADVDLSGSS